MWVETQRDVFLTSESDEGTWPPPRRPLSPLASSRENQPNSRLGGHHNRSTLSGGDKLCREANCHISGPEREDTGIVQELSVNPLTDCSTWLHIPHRTSHRKSGRRGSVVSTETRLQAGWFGVRSREEQEIFVFSVTSSLLVMGSEVSFTSGKADEKCGWPLLTSLNCRS
jgi:hypothetical protein